MVIEVNEVQRIKVLDSIIDKFSDKLTTCKFEQPSNALNIDNQRFVL